MSSYRGVLISITAVLLTIACPQPPLVEAPASVDVPEGRAASFAFTVDPEAEIAIASSVPDELVAVRDGNTIEVTARLGAPSGTITISAGRASDIQNAVDVDVAVNVTPLAFTRVEWADEGPVAREHGALFASEDGATVFLLQGGGYPNFPAQELIADAWQLDVDTGVWSEWAISGDVPAAAGSRRAAQADNLGFLFGGYGDQFVANDELFRVDLDTGVFTRITATNGGPLPRSLHAFAFDAERAQVVVYGGFFANAAGVQNILGDTWFGAVDLDSNTVTWRNLGAGPPARYGMFAGLDGSLSRFVVWSGAGFPSQQDPINAFDDIWVLDLNVDAPEWRELTVDDAPPGRRNGCGVVDPVTHGLFIFGGTADGRTSEDGMFAFDLERELWMPIEREAAPPVRSSAFGAAVPGGGVVCGMGNDAQTYRDLFWLK